MFEGIHGCFIFRQNAGPLGPVIEQALQLSRGVLQKLGPMRGFPFRELLANGLQRGLRAEIGEVTTRAFEDARERVIIFDRDRIEFVIVTAGTGNRRCQKRFTEHIDLIVGQITLFGPDIDGRMFALTEPVKAGAEDRFVRAGDGMLSRR